MTARDAEFGFWQRLGRATGVRDDAGAIDFRTLTRRSSPNDALIAPPDLCENASADFEAPVFAETTQALLARLRGIVAAEPRAREFDAGPERVRFVQRSLLLRYPDVIDAQAFAREGGATLALYSRSLVGRRDFGVNAARLRRWLDALQAGAPRRP